MLFLVRSLEILFLYLLGTRFFFLLLILVFVLCPADETRVFVFTAIRVNRVHLQSAISCTTVIHYHVDIYNHNIIFYTFLRWSKVACSVHYSASSKRRAVTTTSGMQSNESSADTRIENPSRLLGPKLYYTIIRWPFEISISCKLTSIAFDFLPPSIIKKM